MPVALGRALIEQERHAKPRSRRPASRAIDDGVLHDSLRAPAPRSRAASSARGRRLSNAISRAVREALASGGRSRDFRRSNMRLSSNSSILDALKSGVSPSRKPQSCAGRRQPPDIARRVLSRSPISTSAGSTPGHSVLAPRNQRRRPTMRAVWNVLPGMKSCTRSPRRRSGPTITRSLVPSACSMITSIGSPR